MTIHSKGSVNEFPEFVRKAIELDLIEPLNDYVGSGVIDAHEYAIRFSPVETGRFESAWRVTVNKRSYGSPSNPSNQMRYISRTTGKKFYDSELADSRSSASKSMGNFDLRKHKSVFITNNVTYGTYIEHGGKRIRPHNIAKKTESVLNNKIIKAIHKVI